MQDRFKFRMWDKKNNIMVYCEEEATKEQIIQYEEIYDKDEDYCCFQYTDLSCLSLYENDFVVEQCTGLKDKNGKLIYEGDIVKQYDRHRNLLRIGWIVYNVNEMKFKIRTERNPDWNDKTDDFSFHPLKQKLEVIGNIHEQGDKTDDRPREN